MTESRTIRAWRTAAAVAVAAGALTGCRKAEVSVCPEAVAVGNGLQPVTFELSTTSRWSIVCENTWVTASPASGNGSATISLTAVANSTGAERTTRVLVSAGRAEGLVTIPVQVTQPPMTFAFSVDTLAVPKEGGAVTFSVLTDGPWALLSDIPWVESITPGSGLGDTRISLTAAGSDSRRIQEGRLVFTMGTLNSCLPVTLAPLDNAAPYAPTLTAPADGAADVSVLPTFEWGCSDPDGDDLTYTLAISMDGSDWTTFSLSDSTCTLETALDIQTTYQWKVSADDGNARPNSVSVSPVHRFTTGGRTHYADGEWELIHQATVTHPVNLVFTGDGYTEEECRLGGQFISDMKEGVQALFSTEPYKEYQDYFNVWAVAAYSRQRGMTITGQQNRDTRFKVTKTGDETTALTCLEDTVFMYASMVPAVAGDLKNTAVFVMSNQNIYAGTCYMYSTGESIALIPVCRLSDPTVHTEYGSILLHEGGGHGFGQLADEYITYSDRSLPQTGEWSVESVLEFQEYGLWQNISVTKETSLMPWAELIGRDGYSDITNPQGGLYYEFGVWRSEANSCMIDNRGYYSAAQRLAIVKRLKNIARESFSMEDFLAKDTVVTGGARLPAAGSPGTGSSPAGSDMSGSPWAGSSPAGSPGTGPCAGVPDDFRPLGRPVLRKGGYVR